MLLVNNKIMHIAILAPSHKSFISEFLPNIKSSELPEGLLSAPFIGTLIKEMLGMNHSVTAITLTKALNNDYGIKRFKSDNFEWIVVPYRPHSIRFNGNKIGRILDFYHFERFEMIKKIKEICPDIVHAHWSYEYAGVALKCDFPHLITIHDNAIKVLFFFKNIYRLGRLIMSELYLRQANFVSTVSPYMLDYSTQRCLNTHIIPNPTKISFDFEMIKSFISKRSSSLVSAQIVMINNGWDTRKNGKNALLAFQKLKKRMPNVSLHLFGQGSEENGLANKDALSIGLENVNYYGIIPHDKLMDKLVQTHLLLHTSLEESFGVVLIESMSLGIPAIGGINSGAVPWVINDNNLLVDVENAQAIMDKMFEILTNKDVYEKLSLFGYSNVKARFSSENVVKRYIELYDEVLCEYHKNK